MDESLEWKRMCLKMALKARAEGDCMALGRLLDARVESVEMDSGGRTAVQAESALGRCACVCVGSAESIAGRELEI